MDEKERVRKSVSAAYAEAVRSPAACCCPPSPKGVAVQSAGYDRTELEALPADAVVHSFGCGNPLAFGEVREGDVVLDLGCGAGIDLLIAARKVGPGGKVIGVDMTEEMLERARANAVAAGFDNVEVRKGIIEDLPVASGSVDWVVSNCVINLSPDKEKVFAEIARVLKPGGRMLVSDIVAEELPAVVRENEALYCSCVAGAISEADYVAGLRRAGLDPVEVRQRIVYEASHLKGVIESDVPEDLRSRLSSCCGGEGSLDDLASSLEGKVWSAQFVARKPARVAAGVGEPAGES